MVIIYILLAVTAPNTAANWPRVCHPQLSLHFPPLPSPFWIRACYCIYSRSLVCSVQSHEQIVHDTWSDHCLHYKVESARSDDRLRKSRQRAYDTQSHDHMTTASPTVITSVHAGQENGNCIYNNLQTISSYIYKVVKL